MGRRRNGEPSAPMTSDGKDGPLTIGDPHSFPSLDPRAGWALILLCLLVSLLLTLGVLRIQIGAMPGSTWLAIIGAISAARRSRSAILARTPSQSSFGASIMPIR